LKNGVGGWSCWPAAYLSASAIAVVQTKAVAARTPLNLTGLKVPPSSVPPSFAGSGEEETPPCALPAVEPGASAAVAAHCGCDPVPAAVLRAAATVVAGEAGTAAAACCDCGFVPAVVVPRAAAAEAERHEAGSAALLGRGAPQLSEAHKAGLPVAPGAVAPAVTLPIGSAASAGDQRMEAHSDAAVPESAGPGAGPTAARKAAPAAEPVDAVLEPVLRVVLEDAARVGPAESHSESEPEAAASRAAPSPLTQGAAQARA